MKRWQIYFKTDHLPPHLRAISEPFGALAKAIVEGGSAPIVAGGDAAMALWGTEWRACCAVLHSGIDREQTRQAYHLLDLVADGEGEAHDPIDAVLNHLLAAKDCAVRAHIPEPAE